MSLSIVDTGLIANAATGHPWLAGVHGATEDPYTTLANGSTIIVPYAGHGTFVAGVARCMAPKATAYVERAFDIAGANFETMLPPSLADALDRNPDILVFTFCTSSRNDQSLLTFDDFFETRIRYMKGLVVLAPAGNDGKQRRMWPAAYREVISRGGPVRKLAGSGALQQLREVGRCIRAGPGTSSMPFPREPMCAPSLPSGSTGNSMGWPNGTGRRSPPLSSPG